MVRCVHQSTLRPSEEELRNGAEADGVHAIHLQSDRPGMSAWVFAYTYKGTEKIWFCGAFWDAPSKGTDSKAGTVLHEHTHSDASTDDVQYGQPGCRELAIAQPAKAVKNADSHEYY